MRPLWGLVTAYEVRFPRVSGDAPLWTSAWNGITSFSPRERGCAQTPTGSTFRARVFPA